MGAGPRGHRKGQMESGIGAQSHQGDFVFARTLKKLWRKLGSQSELLMGFLFDAGKPVRCSPAGGDWNM